MKIRRVILKGVRNFKDFDHCFEDSWTNEVPDALLLIGPNGSGKSTLLNIIAGLWQVQYDFLEEHEETPTKSYGMPSGTSSMFNITSGSGGFLDEKKQIPEQLFVDLLSGSKLAAIQVKGFLDAPDYWIFAGNDSGLIDRFLADHKKYLRIGRLFTQQGGMGFNNTKFSSHEPGKFQAQGVEVRKKAPTWYTTWREKLVQNVYGSQHNLPNIVYLESESRILQPVKLGGGMTPEPDEFQWLARYEPSTSRKGSLQNYLFAQKAVNLPLFQDILRQINTFFSGKRLVDFSPKTYQMMVDVKGQKHPVDDLSSGEKQVLLMLVTIIRRLEEGGIVMIDEPDLHLHVSLLNAFTSHLRKMISEKKGQLILASHAPELWRIFNEAETIRLGDFKDQEVGQ